MPGKFHHEQLYRGHTTITALATLRIAICGVGAIGSNLADTLARQGATRLRLIDRDRIDEHNISTQTWTESDIGLWKVDALRKALFRATGIEAEALRKDLTPDSARTLLKDIDLIIDAFDNTAARQAVQQYARDSRTATLHVGLSADYGEVIWDEHYRVPRDTQAGDVCDYPLARNLILLTVAVAAETILAFAADGRQPSWSATLKDFAIRALQP